MKYTIFKLGESASFPEGDAFLSQVSAADSEDAVIYCGIKYTPDASKRVILVELNLECLGEHTDESDGTEGSNVVGFARYRNGSDGPSKLVELVRQPQTQYAALSAAREIFENAGLEVVVSSDQPGRIISRLVCPKYNAAFRFLDEGLATQKDMDLTCRLGLGYPDGPIERVLRGGLDNHYVITNSLFNYFGTAAYVPARRATVAFNRRKLESSD